MSANNTMSCQCLWKHDLAIFGVKQIWHEPL